MTSGSHTARIGTILLALSTLALGGCASLVSGATSRFAGNLSAAVMNQDDPETARDAIPSYMVLIDSLIEGNPDDPDILSAAAELYASYGVVFANDPARAARLTSRARRYGLKAICTRYDDACDWRSDNYDEFVSSLAGVGHKNAKYLYSYGVATLAYLRAHSDDFDTLAELPQAEALFEHYLDIAGDGVKPATYTYLGILETLRPPALGGEPDKAQANFERAIELSGGRDLSAKVEYARGYARLLYDRELHDRLLLEVVEADPYVDGLTLSNVLAQDDARALLASADDYF